MDARNRAMSCNMCPTNQLSCRRCSSGEIGIGCLLQLVGGDTCPLLNVVVRPWQGHKKLQLIMCLLISNRERHVNKVTWPHHDDLGDECEEPWHRLY